MTTFRKDPDAVEDFGRDWSVYLADDTIRTSEWIVPVGLVKQRESNTTAATVVWISGGTDGQDYELVNRITTMQGRTADASLAIRIRSDPSQDFPISSDFKRGVFSGGGGLTDDDIEEIIRGWEARVTAANGGILENEPFARSVVRQGARAQFEGEALRMSGRLAPNEATGSEARVEKLLKGYGETRSAPDPVAAGPASVHNVSEEPLW